MVRKYLSNLPHKEVFPVILSEYKGERRKEKHYGRTFNIAEE
jgi:hypothetical protein